MLKRGLMLFACALLLITLVSASSPCNLEVSLLNQDPYPAVPGDYVKLVFQITGVENADCQNVVFELVPKYPISFDPNVESRVEIKAGTFTKDYSSSLMVPFKVRVDPDALEGDNPLEVLYSSGLITQSTLSKQFNLHVEDVRVDFEVYIKDYQPSTKILTLEILNIGESDVEALTIEIPEQENINVKGSSINIVGDLDSNDYTTAEFEASPEEGEIELTIYYSDEINTRRTTTEKVYFNPEMFEGRNGESKGLSTSTYILILIVIAGFIYWIYRRQKKKKAKHKSLHK